MLSRWTFTDHKQVLTAALKQVPARFRRQALVRVDGADASHDLIAHLLSLPSPREKLLFTCGWTILPADEDAIRLVPAGAWKPGTAQDGGPAERLGSRPLPGHGRLPRRCRMMRR
jgi:hypothetical protein